MAERLSRQQVVQQAAAAFSRAGIEDALTDARILVAHALGVDRIALVTDQDAALSALQAATIEGLVARRLRREPVSRILGYRWFRGRQFSLSPATLDPRPDSETLIDAVLDFVQTRQLQDRPLRLLDVGTGTGCLLLTLLAELPLATGVGVDLSKDALETAATNATALGIGQDRVTWIAGDGPGAATGLFNIVLSNPPYIPSADIEALEPEVRAYDPRLALDGGEDGLRCYQTWSKIIIEAIDNKCGFLIYEVGVGQADAVVQLLAAHAGPGFDIATHGDLGGHVRCVSAATRLVTARSA
jgi:release factor glutamine methyltransferase